MHHIDCAIWCIYCIIKDIYYIMNNIYKKNNLHCIHIPTKSSQYTHSV